MVSVAGNKWPGRLRRLRQRRKWSQERAATEMRVSLSTYAKWEQGVHVPHGQLVERVREVVRAARVEAREGTGGASHAAAAGE